jgi:hypothetical protein
MVVNFERTITVTIDPDAEAPGARRPVRRRRSHAALGSRVFVGGLAISGTVGLAGVMARRPAVAAVVPARESSTFVAEAAHTGTPPANVRRAAALAAYVAAVRQVAIATPPSSSTPAPAPVLSPAPTAPAPVQAPVPAQTAALAPPPSAPPTPSPAPQPPATVPVVAAPAAAPITTSHASPPPP